MTLVLTACSLPSNTYLTELPIRVYSPIAEEACLLLGQEFPVTMEIQAPIQWENQDGSSSQEVWFRLQRMGEAPDSVVFLNVTQQREFELIPETLAMTDLSITVKIDNGDVIVYRLDNFPFFEYTRREGDSHFCVQLPGEEQFEEKKSIPMLQA